MSAIGVEALLARLYTEPALRAAFLADPHTTKTCAGADLTSIEIDLLAAIDQDGLILTARSIASKRDAYQRPRARRWWPWRRI